MKNTYKIHDEAHHTRNEDIKIYHIVSEPGDGTRYDYIMIIHDNEYLFVSYENDFRYPQRLNYYDVVDLSEEEMFALANQKICNFYTLAECIRSIKEHKEKK